MSLTEPKPKQDNRIQFRAEPHLLNWLRSRAERYSTGGSIHLQAEHDLIVLRELFAAEKRQLRFSVSDLNALADLTQATAFTAGDYGAGTLAAELADALSLAATYPDDEEDISAKWGVDGAALLDNLRQLGPAAEAALIDALAERRQTSAELNVAGWRSVGLLPIRQDNIIRR